ncbi:hypothetical protein OG762_04535 [Streptomyces sp. NBC_01136]|uniref:hypothetical protein n=1 Tax=unclassified Streptomyces TaxID=2593676 RepID=UPI0032489296|nr:hypothetical protein OG762_04535 [Streptomyces sp. NBC_01136]
MTAPHLTGCSTTNDQPDPDRPKTLPSPAPSSSSRGKVLIAYFSRPGENYHYGDRTHLKVGNTEVMARKIRDLIGGDMYRIEAADPYPRATPLRVGWLVLPVAFGGGQSPRSGSRSQISRATSSASCCTK